jgi:hypothetical protein
LPPRPALSSCCCTRPAAAAGAPPAPRSVPSPPSPEASEPSSCGSHAAGSHDPAGDPAVPWSIQAPPAPIQAPWRRIELHRRRFDLRRRPFKLPGAESSFTVVNLTFAGAGGRGGHGGSEAVEERQVREGDAAAGSSPGLESSSRLLCRRACRVCSASFLCLLYLRFRSTHGLLPALSLAASAAAAARPARPTAATRRTPNVLVICLRGERVCIFASPLSSEGTLPSLLHHLLEEKMERHSGVRESVLADKIKAT